MAISNISTNPSTRCASTIDPTSRHFSNAKESRLRRWAARIVSDLPPDPAESQRVLELAEQLRRQWVYPQAVRKGGAR